MKKRIAIIGAGISGLTLANFLKKDSKYDFTIYEKEYSLNLNAGYGMQLSVNSVSILNKIGFKDLKIENKFNPKKLDFYSLNNNKICDLDLTQFNLKDINYTTLKRPLLIEFLKERLFTNCIQYNKKIKKINYSNSKIEIKFENNSSDIFDYLVIADGIFSQTKSILFSKNIKPKYSGSLAVRALIKKRKDIKFLNESNISLFLGSKIHIVAYAINKKNEFNLIAIIRKKLNKRYLVDESFFRDKGNIKELLEDSLIQGNSNLKNLFYNVEDIKCFPTFVSDKIYQPKQKNIFIIGDAFYALMPTFAQGSSQSIESAYELFNTLNENNFKKYFLNRIKRIKMINRRSKFNYYIFHLSNPIFVFLRNLILKIVIKNKTFLNKYLGQVYSRN